MATPLLTDQAIAEMLAGAQPVPQAQAAPATTPQQMFNLPSPIPQTRFFGGRSSRYGDPFAQQEKYRKAVMEQQADQQAQALLQELEIVPPNAPDAPAKRLQLLTQYPLSQQSEIGKTILSAWDKEAERFHKGLSGDKSEDLIGQLAEYQATDEEIKSVFDTSGRINTVKARRMIGELKSLQSAEKKVKKTEQELMDEEIKSLRDVLDNRFKLGIGEKEENDAFLKRLRELENKRFQFPAAAVPPPAGGVAPTPGVRQTSSGNTAARMTTPSQ